MLTIEDIRHPDRKSGFRQVNYAPAKAKNHYMAYEGGGRPGDWRGPRRATAEEAAQDYCDRINGRPVAPPAILRNPGHATRAATPRNEEVEAALGVLRDHRAQRQGKQGYVYLIIEVRPGGGLRYGKIGYSTNPLARVGELQAGNPRPLALHLAKPGTEADERALHARYIDHNTVGEWFRITRELLLEFPGELPEEVAA